MHILRWLVRGAEGAIVGAAVAAAGLAIFDGSLIGWVVIVSVLGVWAVATPLLQRPLKGLRVASAPRRPERVTYSGWDTPPREEQRAQEDGPNLALRTRGRRPPYLLEVTSIVVGIAAGVAAVASVIL